MCHSPVNFKKKIQSKETLYRKKNISKTKVRGKTMFFYIKERHVTRQLCISKKKK
jgi:hypothetical protein